MQSLLETERRPTADILPSSPLARTMRYMPCLFPMSLSGELSGKECDVQWLVLPVVIEAWSQGGPSGKLKMNLTCAGRQASGHGDQWKALLSLASKTC